ncbi:hypothetical protein [Streptomyces sp. NBC_00842]|uniref:hypothetical protein n=1 Tax=Streptomyces sp. NBC_00842 TaxID=2975848 RepID=UPI002F90FE5C|nr:hypothetical protein OH821_45140 [Streptomyces sp. NBC_00842]
MTDIGAELARMRKDIERLQRAARLSYASLDDTALEVRDSAGSLRGVFGQQGDGTTAVNVVNGPPPPAPSAPIVTSVLGGVTVSWDGAFADGAVMPLDWSRVEVHASPLATYTPTAATLKATVETAQGCTVVIATPDPVYVQLVARSTSGTASPPSSTVGPVGPTPVVASDILDGIVTTVKLADAAVSAAKVAVNAVGSTALADGAVLSAKLAAAAVSVGKIADNAVTGPAIASDAVTAGKVAADAITAREIAAGAVTASEIAAGSITTDKLTVVGGTNVLNDPSFEGVYAASIAAKFSQWAVQDKTFGNGSVASMKLTTDGTSMFRAVELTLLPTMAGQQIYIAVDYYASTDWAGGELNMHIRWEAEGGATLVTDKAQTRVTAPVKGAWTRIAGTYTAPAAAVRARVRIETGLVTAGSTWFDNAECRPIVPGVQIADGAITTPKIVAGAVQTAQLDALAVNASKIAAGAVTTAKLDALAVTADKIAANAITVGKLEAGSVDATALKADAITGKTITGGTITGTNINGATVTGSEVRTGTSGERIVLTPTPPFPLAQRPSILLYSNAASELGPGLLNSGVTSGVPSTILGSQATATDALGRSIRTTLGLIPPNPGTHGGRFVLTTLNPSGSTTAGFVAIDGTSATDASGQAILDLVATDGATTPKTSQLSLGAGRATLLAEALDVLPPATTLSAIYLNAATGHTGSLLRLQLNGADRLNVSTAGDVTTPGVLTAGNFASGSVAITPSAANKPTSVSVSGLAVQGANLRAFISIANPAPGFTATTDGVTGVGFTNLTSAGLTVWATRQNTTAVTVNWLVYGHN